MNYDILNNTNHILQFQGCSKATEPCLHGLQVTYAASGKRKQVLFCGFVKDLRLKSRLQLKGEKTARSDTTNIQYIT